MSTRRAFVGFILASGFSPAVLAAPALGPVVGKGTSKLVVTPPQAGVGEKLAITFIGFPKPSPRGDALLVVPAGTRDFDPNNVQANSPNPSGIKLFYKKWIHNEAERTEYDGGDLTVGPFAPGAYEARYVTLLYNNDRRYEASARTLFDVG